MMLAVEGPATGPLRFVFRPGVATTCTLSTNGNAISPSITALTFKTQSWRLVVAPPLSILCDAKKKYSSQTAAWAYKSHLCCVHSFGITLFVLTVRLAAAAEKFQADLCFWLLKLYHADDVSCVILCHITYISWFDYPEGSLDVTWE